MANLRQVDAPRLPEGERHVCRGCVRVSCLENNNLSPGCGALRGAVRVSQPQLCGHCSARAAPSLLAGLIAASPSNLRFVSVPRWHQLNEDKSRKRIRQHRSHPLGSFVPDSVTLLFFAIDCRKVVSISQLHSSTN